MMMPAAQLIRQYAVCLNMPSVQIAYCAVWSLIQGQYTKLFEHSFVVSHCHGGSGVH
jgi:hypothetical protein